MDCRFGNRPSFPCGGHFSNVEKGAHAGNTPSRPYKRYAHEGGISSLLIAHQPKGIPGPMRLSLSPSISLTTPERSCRTIQQNQNEPRL
jgi:hypothetical protein